MGVLGEKLHLQIELFLQKQGLMLTLSLVKIFFKIKRWKRFFFFCLSCLAISNLQQYDIVFLTDMEHILKWIQIKDWRYVQVFHTNKS